MMLINFSSETLPTESFSCFPAASEEQVSTNLNIHLTRTRVASIYTRHKVGWKRSWRLGEEDKLSGMHRLLLLVYSQIKSMNIKCHLRIAYPKVFFHLGCKAGVFGVIRTRHPQLRDGLVSCGHQFEVLDGIHS